MKTELPLDSRYQNTDVWRGFAIGIFVPILPLAVVWLLMKTVAALREADLLLIGCVALNMLVMKYFFKQGRESLGRGVLGATFLWALAFFLFKELYRV